MAESPLDKVMRLAAVPVRSFQRVENGRLQRVRQYSQNRQPGTATPPAGKKPAGHPAAGNRFGTPFRSAWSKVALGDVLELGGQLWRIIPASQYPGHKPATRHGVSTGSGPGQVVTTTVGAGTPAAKTTPGSNTSSQSSTGTARGGGSGTASGGTPANGTAKVQVYEHFLQNMKDPSRFSVLRLPGNYVVTLVPILP